MLALALSTSAFVVLTVVPVVSPSTGAQIADVIRSTAGPQVVASIETISFRVQDAVNQFLSVHTGGQPQISFNQAPVPLPAPLLRRAVPGPTPQAAPPSPALNTFLAPASDVVSADPAIGWQPYGPQVNGAPVMAQALLTLDPSRPYAAIALVRIDLSKLQLHMVPGFLEPSHTAAVQNAIPNLGSMPSSDQSKLIAGFNGGFKAVNGHYGMGINGVILLPPQNGLATVALYSDGHVQIGTWGEDLFPSPDMVAYRQNCPPIIRNGQVTPQVNIDNPILWGDTIGNQEITWRTGLGITVDGRYLIYAVGNGTSVAYLAQALQEAGAYYAMQLDINRHYAHFVTYKASNSGALTAVQLLSQMESDPNLYLVPHSRDFFYLTTR